MHATNASCFLPACEMHPLPIESIVCFESCLVPTIITILCKDSFCRRSCVLHSVDNKRRTYLQQKPPEAELRRWNLTKSPCTHSMMDAVSCHSDCCNNKMLAFV